MIREIRNLFVVNIYLQTTPKAHLRNRFTNYHISSMEKALEKWNKKNVWNGIRRNWILSKWIPWTPIWCPWKKCVTFMPRSIPLILFLVVKLNEGMLILCVVQACILLIWALPHWYMIIIIDYFVHVLDCCRKTSDPRSGFSTVEKEVPGSLTPMLGDRKVGSFELNIIFLFFV